jgi:hypothetical protein
MRSIASSPASTPSTPSKRPPFGTESVRTGALADRVDLVDPLEDPHRGDRNAGYEARASRKLAGSVRNVARQWPEQK